MNFLVAVDCRNTGTTYSTTKNGALIQKATQTCVTPFVGILLVLDRACQDVFKFDQGKYNNIVSKRVLDEIENQFFKAINFFKVAKY